MKKSSRELVKKGLGISESLNNKGMCKKCNFHGKLKVCQIHMIKTKDNDLCGEFKPQFESKVYRGGGISPK